MNIESLLSSIIVGVIGLAIVAVIVSQRASTSSVIGSSGNALANVIKAAVSPVAGGTTFALPQTITSTANFSAANN